MRIYRQMFQCQMLMPKSTPVVTCTRLYSLRVSHTHSPFIAAIPCGVPKTGTAKAFRNLFIRLQPEMSSSHFDLWILQFNVGSVAYAYQFFHIGNCVGRQVQLLVHGSTLAILRYNRMIMHTSPLHGFAYAWKNARRYLAHVLAHAYSNIVRQH